MAVVRQEALLGLLQVLGELVNWIGLFDGQVSHALNSSNLQRVLSTVLHLGVHDRTSVMVTLVLKLVLGTSKNFVLPQHPFSLGVGLGEVGLKHNLLFFAFLAGDIDQRFRESI